MLLFSQAPFRSWFLGVQSGDSCEQRECQPSGGDFWRIWFGKNRVDKISYAIPGSGKSSTEQPGDRTDLRSCTTFRKFWQRQNPEKRQQQSVWKIP